MGPSLLRRAIIDPAMAGLSIRTWSNDPPEEKLGLLVGAIFAAIGTLMLITALVHLSHQPWDLRERGIAIEGVQAEHDPFTGDRYRIVVDGKSHVCHRGAEKLGRGKVVVLYDPADPSRCRAEDTADGPGSYEATLLPFSLPFALMGVSLMLARLAEPRPPWGRTEPSGLLRPKLMWISRALAIVAVLLGVVALPILFASGTSV